MKRNRIALAAALAAVAALGAAVVVLAAWDRGGSDTENPPVQIDPIAATAAFSPRIALFGDTLTATVDVVVDKTIVDVDQVEVTASFEPWRPIGQPRKSRDDSGRTAHLQTTYLLRCLTRFCVPARETEEVEFAEAEVTYAAPAGEGTRRLSLDVTWPTLVVHSRVSQTDDRRDVLAAPWRADLVSVPPTSYSIAPGLLLALLVLGGAGLFVVAGILVYRAIPERKPPPEPEPEPIPVATLLEQALAYLEAPVSSNGAAERRRALELVADEVESWGDTKLAQTARALAWSEHAPEGEMTKAFAADLRSRMESLNGHPG